jgi:hypothetical protein
MPGRSAAGAFARINLVLKRLDNVLMVPTESIVPVLKGKQVFVTRNGKAEVVNVEPASATIQPHRSQRDIRERYRNYFRVDAIEAGYSVKITLK